MGERNAYQLTDDKIIEFKKAFYVFDKNLDDFICTIELHHVMTNHGENVTHEEPKLFKEVSDIFVFKNLIRKEPVKEKRRKHIGYGNNFMEEGNSLNPILSLAGTINWDNNMQSWPFIERIDACAPLYESVINIKQFPPLT
ncbi:hypothetical protein Lal_00026062 [Lupinus albus]|nr:hypothetical protein Lal_00026062 [Lupinus albus]